MRRNLPPGIVRYAVPPEVPKYLEQYVAYVNRQPNPFEAKRLIEDYEPIGAQVLTDLMNLGVVVIPEWWVYVDGQKCYNSYASVWKVKYEVPPSEEDLMPRLPARPYGS